MHITAVKRDAEFPLLLSTMYLREYAKDHCGHTYACREDILIVDERFNPVHQKVHILEGWEFGGLLVMVSILPSVLIARASRHDRATSLCAEFTNCSIYQVDTVKEIYHMHSNPVINVLSLRQLNHLPEVQP